ncbi:hypothetical protein, partial [Lysobacter sp. 22409]
AQLLGRSGASRDRAVADRCATAWSAPLPKGDGAHSLHRKQKGRPKAAFRTVANWRRLTTQSSAIRFMPSAG